MSEMSPNPLGIRQIELIYDPPKVRIYDKEGNLKTCYIPIWAPIYGTLDVQTGILRKLGDKE